VSGDGKHVWGITADGGAAYRDGIDGGWSGPTGSGRYLHWLVMNVRNANVSTGSTITSYIAPTNQELQPRTHVLAVYEQKRHLTPGAIQQQQQQRQEQHGGDGDSDSNRKRSSFDPATFASTRYTSGDFQHPGPTAMTWLKLQYDSYSPVRLAQKDVAAVAASAKVTTSSGSSSSSGEKLQRVLADSEVPLLLESQHHTASDGSNGANSQGEIAALPLPLVLVLVLVLVLRRVRVVVLGSAHPGYSPPPPSSPCMSQARLPQAWVRGGWQMPLRPRRLTAVPDTAGRCS
jgi:hypothetical protein